MTNHSIRVTLAIAAFSVCGWTRSALAQDAAQVLTLDRVVLHPMVEAEVPAAATGVLATIAVEEGAVVQKGDLLAALDDRAARLTLEKTAFEREQAFAKASNELRIKYADKALEVARAEVQRSGESLEQFPKSISQSQLDVERLTVEKLELERQQAEHDLELERYELRLKENAQRTAELELELHSVRAPFAGVVSLIRGRAGEWVQPGAPVARLVAVDVLRAEGFAPADAEIAVGATVRFTLLGPDGKPAGGEAIEGVLQYVSPEIDPLNGQVRVWAAIKNQPVRLRPGQQGTLQLPLTKGGTP